MMNEWDGETERRRTPSDHDNLIRVITLLAQHVKNFDNHVEDDKVMAKDVRFSTKMIYMGMGALGALQMVIIFIKH